MINRVAQILGDGRTMAVSELDKKVLLRGKFYVKMHCNGEKKHTSISDVLL